MILFITLLLIMLILTVVTIAVISVAGASFIIIFGDVIVCIFIIGWIIKKIIQKSKK